MSNETNPNNNTVDNTVTDPQHEEGDYADPESPTLAIRRQASPTTGDTEGPADDFDLADYIDKPIPSMMVDPPPSVTSGTGIYAPNLPLIKRRRLDMGDLMVKTTGQAKPISDKPAEQFRTVR